MTLSAARREAVELLCAAQAEGRIPDSLFEQRLAAIQQAPNDASIQAVIADLREDTPGFGMVAHEPDPPPIPFAEQLRVSSVLTSTRREGNWIVPWRLELLTILGEMQIDFRDAVLPDDVIDVHLTATLGSIVLIVPKGTLVQNEVEAVLGSSEITRKRKPVVPPNGLTLRVTGRAVLGSVEIREK